MRLASFILEHTESILTDWEIFARACIPGKKMDKLALRDHAADILRATARDMMSTQSAREQSDKSKGHGGTGAASVRLDGASEVHALARVSSGFNLLEVVAEYRALRASVVQLWRASQSQCDSSDLDDLTRFNEAIDQSLTEAVASYITRVDQSRQMFLAMLGHDLRNPLNAILMSAEVLSLPGNTPQETLETTGQIRDSGNAMGRMIHDLLDFTSTRLGAKLPVVLSPVDLQPLCERVLEECRAAHPTNPMGFFSEGPVSVDGDAGRLRQAISNLLGNAVQHGEKGGRIDLTLRTEESSVLVSVRNLGPPIPQEKLVTIFDPLVGNASAQPQLHRRPGSIGLGLYIVREVATAHEGSIDVTSSLESGTQFTLRLPRPALPEA